VPAPRFRAYIAASLDGFIADPRGGVGWLDPFNQQEYGYDAFLAGIGLIITGRATFDDCLRLGDWPYGEIPVLVLTHRPLPDGLPPTVQAVQGSIDTLLPSIETRSVPGDVWILGGGRVLGEFFRAGRVDSLELFVMPVLLGEGIPLFPVTGGTLPELTLHAATPYENGVVQLHYQVKRRGN